MADNVTRHQRLNSSAEAASQRVITQLGAIGTKTAAVLGTGWGGSVKLIKSMKLADIHPLFGTLADLSGHARMIGIAIIGGKRVLVVSGRIHMYEGNRDAVYLLMRILWELGIRKLILTSASGGMRDCIRKGDLVVVMDIVSHCPSPVDGPPFPVPGPMIRHDLMQTIWGSVPVGRVHIGNLAVNQGPALESPGNRLRVDQPGIQCVGMSGSAETECFASFVEQDDLKTGKHAFVVPITCISNGLNDPHSHKGNTETMIANQKRLASMLTHVVEQTARQRLKKR